MADFFGSWGLPRFQPLAREARSFPARWARAVGRRVPSEVLALYAPNAVLVPTFSRTILQGVPQLGAYFAEFLARPGLRCRIDNQIVQELSPEIQVISGDYSFSQLDPNRRGKRSIIRARFTFALVWDPVGQWKIATHHSSQRPK